MQDNRIESRFNAGLAKLQRIDWIKKQLHYARINDEYDIIYKCLICLHSELSFKMKDEERKKANELKNNANSWVASASDKSNNINENILYNALFSYEDYLNMLESKFGMGMPDKEDVSDVISIME